ncbi:neurotrimin-like [Agrilus planipennis]|uniref:Neurotrimin-like n=1 Tax=Agrilus planipennis TaxID=224129 RepID=A0A7F5RBG3_AGRPL|nr:neurotrimin-like [Agrilus planipennis]
MGRKCPIRTATSSWYVTLTVVIITCCCFCWASVSNGEPNSGGPRFNGPISNVTVPVGRDAMLKCSVDNLSIYKVAWLRVDTQTILTIHVHVITKNNRIGVTHSEQKTWYLHIRNVKESDRGWYMCQINTDPMKSQVGFLDVVVPPDILDSPTSADLTVHEGSNITFKCAARGSPDPAITWRREGGEPISLGNGNEVLKIEGSEFEMVKVNRLQMGPYLCIASNGVPPSVSKRIMLDVHFPPMISIANQLVGAYQGQKVSIECRSEAFPKSMNYWTKEDDITIVSDGKYKVDLEEHSFKKRMKLHISNVSPSDFGIYKCVAKNSLGEADGSIKIYPLPLPTTTSASTTPTRPMENVIIIEKLASPAITKYQPDINNSFENVVEAEIGVISTANEVHSYKSYDTWALSSSVGKSLLELSTLACLLLIYVTNG